MTSGITLITPTGGRPASFTRCASYVHRFIKPKGVPIQWIVIDDYGDVGNSLYVPGVNFKLILPKHVWVPGANTLGKNLLAALPHVEHTHVLFIEDDDWYSSEYLMSMYEALHDAETVGEIPARYYHIPQRQYSVLTNVRHASLCQTGIRSSMLQKLEEVCLSPRTEFIDVRLWETISTKVLLKTRLCVGLKGLPGRPGIGIGHTPQRNPKIWTSDNDLSVLKQWIGEDARFYQTFNALQTF